VGGLAFGLKGQGASQDDTQAIPYQCFPTVYVWAEKEDEAGFQIVTAYPRDQLVRSAATGAAFFLCHRSVLERIAEAYGEEWFNPVEHPCGTTFSEDLSFFVRAAGVDAPLWIDTRVKTSHDKGGVFLTEEVWDAQEAIKAIPVEEDERLAG